MKPLFTFWRFLLLNCLVLVLTIFQTHAQWKQCNGPLGGLIYTMTQSGTTLLAAIDNHGVFRSIDKGEHWTQTDIGEGITVNLLTPVGSASVYACSDSGLYRSKDNGATWKLLLKSKKYEIFRAFTMKGATLFAGSAGVGVYRSTDDGVTWTETNLGLHSKSITSLTTIDTFIVAGTYGNGVYRSPDNGDGWWPLYVNVPDPNAMSFERFLVAAQDSVLYCGLSEGMQYSKDLGITWESCDTGREFKWVSYLQIIDSTIYTIAGRYVYYSTNHGDSWKPLYNNIIPANFSSIAIVGNEWYLGSFGDGIFKTSTQGSQWQTVNTGVTYQNVTKLASQGTSIYAGTRNSGVYKSEDHGASWQHLGLYSQSIEALCVRDSIILASTEQVIFRSTDGGRTWGDTIYTKFFVREFVYMDTVVFAGALGLYPISGKFRPIYKSLDRGKTWTEVPFELEKTILYALKSVNSTLFAVGKGLFRSTDFGATWQDTDTMFNHSYIQDLSQLGTSIIITAENGDVFRSEDMGTSWVKIDTGLLSEYAYSICSNGKSTYLGNYTKGIFKSENTGVTWTDANGGLTDTTGTVLCFAGTTLYLGTSSGVWKIENASDVLEDNFQFAQNHSLTTYPNPTSSELTIDCSSLLFNPTNSIHYTISTITGEILQEFERAESRFTLSTAGIGTGVYCLIARQGMRRSSTLFSVVK